MKIYITTIVDWMSGDIGTFCFASSESQDRALATDLYLCLKDVDAGFIDMPREDYNEIRQLLCQEKIGEALDVFNYSQQQMTIFLHEKDLK